MITDKEKEELSKNIDALYKAEADSATGSFAGSNSDKLPAEEVEVDPAGLVDPTEVQNNTDDIIRLSDEEAEHARNKAAGGIHQHRDS